MKPHSNSLPDETPLGEASDLPLDRAIRAIVAESVPGDSLARTLSKALTLDSEPSLGRSRVRRYSLAISGAVAVAAMAILLSSLNWNGAPPGGPAKVPLPSPGEGSPVARSGAGEAKATGEALSFTAFTPHPAAQPVVAAKATIFATVGPERSTALGARVTREELTGGTSEDATRIHVWNWSESDRSQVVTVPRVYGWMRALSPDGKVLLYSSGTSVNLLTRETHPVDGLRTLGDEVLWSMRYSPTGRYVLAWIRADSPPSSPRLRVVDMSTGGIVTELSASWNAAFLPDESSLIYSRPHAEIPRREVVARIDLETGEVLVEYDPLLSAEGRSRLGEDDLIREVVGIEVSGDGRLVAVGFYYGQLFVWETETGRAVSHAFFRRADGTRDTFFQAKLMSFSQDGTLLAALSGSRLKVVDTRSGNVLADHYHPETPPFAHLRWAAEKRVLLLSDSTLVYTRSEASLRPQATAEIFPRLYVWDWELGPPLLESRPESDE